MSTRVVTSKLRQPSWPFALHHGSDATAAAAAVDTRNPLRSMGLLLGELPVNGRRNVLRAPRKKKPGRSRAFRPTGTASSPSCRPLLPWLWSCPWPPSASPPSTTWPRAWRASPSASRRRSGPSAPRASPVAPSAPARTRLRRRQRPAMQRAASSCALLLTLGSGMDLHRSTHQRAAALTLTWILWIALLPKPDRSHGGSRGCVLPVASVARQESSCSPGVACHVACQAVQACAWAAGSSVASVQLPSIPSSTRAIGALPDQARPRMVTFPGGALLFLE